MSKILQHITLFITLSNFFLLLGLIFEDDLFIIIGLGITCLTFFGLIIYELLLFGKPKDIDESYKQIIEKRA